MTRSNVADGGAPPGACDVRVLEDQHPARRQQAGERARPPPTVAEVDSRNRAYTTSANGPLPTVAATSSAASSTLAGTSAPASATLTSSASVPSTWPSTARDRSLR